MGFVLHFDAAAIEDKGGFDLIIVEYFDHIEDIVEILGGVDILGPIKATAIAAPINPRHNIDSSPHPLETGNMLFFCDGFEKLQKSVNPHAWRDV